MHGSGWNTLLHFGTTTIRGKVLFGSAWDVVGIPVEQLFEEVRALPLRQESLERWLRGKAREFMESMTEGRR